MNAFIAQFGRLLVKLKEMCFKARFIEDPRREIETQVYFLIS